MDDNLHSDLRYWEADLHMRRLRAEADELHRAQQLARPGRLSRVAGTLLLLAGGVLSGIGTALMRAGATLMGEVVPDT
jgi:hypothetical protein